MKYLLYLYCYYYLSTVASEPKDFEYFDLLYEPYNKALLEEQDFKFEDGMDSFGAMRFLEDNPISVPVDKLNFADAEIFTPFTINAVFKSDEDTSCLFSITDEDDIQLSLCFTLVAPSITRVTVEGKGIKNLYFTIAEDLQIWTKMSLDVEENRAALNINCSDTQWLDINPIEKIHLTKESKLNLGHYGGGTNFFNGVIQELRIYPTSSKDAKICADDLLFPDSTGVNTKGNLKPENLKFIDGSEALDIPPKGEKGDSGEKGCKGEPGASLLGPQGPVGPQGPPGSPGKKGEMGSCSCTEGIVSNLLRKMPEMKGPQGPMGPKGEIGDTGLPGLTGKEGKQGKEGPPGIKGETGERGDDGAHGKDGERGQKGDPGKPGDSGPPGPQGIMGPPGPPGSVIKGIEEESETAVPGEKGEQGPIGPPGSPGPPGLKGEIGEIGPRGEKGDKGERGHHGPAGPRGEKGDQGTSGKDGFPGEPGAHGRPAEKGDKGDKGESGSPGAPGLPATLTSLLDPEMDKEENAVLLEKLRGLKGERGVTGDKGEIGDVGPMGLQGQPGKDGNHGARGHQGLQGEIGPVGPKGEKGEPGLLGDFNISNDVIKSIKGQKGDRGDLGPHGKIGVRGQIGHPGKKGQTGSKGAKGSTGAVGPQGRTGPKGEVGSSGIKGEKGDIASDIDMKKLKGEKGDKGIDGRPGEPGTPGPPGQCINNETYEGTFIPGPPGPPGPPGLSIRGPKGEPGAFFAEKNMYMYSDDADNINDEDNELYTAATVVYKSTKALLKKSSTTRPGTLAYVLQEKTLLIKIENGWQYVVMGSLFQLGDLHPTTMSPMLNDRLVQGDQNTNRLSRKSFIRLAALNEPLSGMMYFNNQIGRHSANSLCRRESRLFGYDGNFEAFLSNNIEDLGKIVKDPHDRQLPVVNLKGNVLFDSWQSMFNGSEAMFPETVNVFSFSGRNILTDSQWPVKLVWHGGDSFGKRSPQTSCQEWSTDNPNFFGAASSLKHFKLLGQEKYPCNSKLIVLCVESIATRRRKRHSPSRLRSRYSHSRLVGL